MAVHDEIHFRAFSKQMACFTLSMRTSIVLLWVFACTFGSSLDTSISYEEYCRDTLSLAEEEGRRHGAPPLPIPSNFTLNFHGAFFSGGFPLFDTKFAYFSWWSRYSAQFYVSSVKLEGEQAAEQYVVAGTLLLHNRRTRFFRHQSTRIRDSLVQPGVISLTLKGLWVVRSGTLCMAGCFEKNMIGQSNSRDDCQVKAVFQYPLENSIRQPVVKGVIESKRQRKELLFFEPVYITGVANPPYIFRKDDENAENWAVHPANVPDNIQFWNDDTAVCQFPWQRNRLLPVTWDKQCTGPDCKPFEGMIPGGPTYLSVEKMFCAEGKIHGFFIFTHHAASAFRNQYDVLSVEGVWNTSTGQLYASACYLKGVANNSLRFDSEDCDFQITLQFPTTLSLLFRYNVVGRVERKKGSKLSSFRPFSFTGAMHIPKEFPTQLKYTYTEQRIKQARNHCQASSPQHSKRGWMGKEKLKYPDGQIFADFGFQATMKDSSGVTTAVFSPVAINGRTDMFFSATAGVVTSAATSEDQTRSMNISFDINFHWMEKPPMLLENTTFPKQFPAEGVYDSQTGMLCLSACRSLAKSSMRIGSKLSDDDKDCEIVIAIQYPLINAGLFDKHKATGKLMSIRDQKDSLFFNPVFFSSASLLYQEQAANSLMAMNFEIIMGIISLTMGVLLIGLQIRHVKKNPKVLPQMSLLMLTVLTLGHLISLVLNFEAFFPNRSKKNYLQWRSGWIETNEVIVRLLTMLVFLMLLRLLHLSWVSKSEVSPGVGPWQMERGTLRICLKVYVLGGLIALIVYNIKGSNVLDVGEYLWEIQGAVLSAGLIIADFFLFPQVVGNYLWEIQGTVLSAPFYLGMTLVRVLPHLYDVLGKLEFIEVINRRYDYADPTWDYYFDAVIPFGSVLLAVLVCVQQRYGGACFSLSSWRKTRPYSEVSMNPI